jgi:hypothetical protein
MNDQFCVGESCIDESEVSEPYVAVAATIFLMSKYAMQPQPQLAAIIRCHLCALSKLDLPVPLRTTAGNLVRQWDKLAVEPAPVVERSFIHRIVNASRSTH